MNLGCEIFQPNRKHINVSLYTTITKKNNTNNIGTAVSRKRNALPSWEKGHRRLSRVSRTTSLCVYNTNFASLLFSSFFWAIIHFNFIVCDDVYHLSRRQWRFELIEKRVHYIASGVNVISSYARMVMVSCSRKTLTLGELSIWQLNIFIEISVQWNTIELAFFYFNWLTQCKFQASFKGNKFLMQT